MHKTTWTLIAALALFAIGCVDDPPETIEPGGAELLVPNMGGKADVGSRVNRLGRLKFDSEARGELTEDLEFHAYTFRVFEQSQVTVEVTQRGSSRALDTSLFVFGPSQSSHYGTTALASDRDSGWGTLSKIDGVALSSGTYLAVVGSPDGTGRGHYRLTIDCVEGACVDPDTETNTDLCDPKVDSWLGRCLFDTMKGPDILEPEALERCRFFSRSGGLLEFVCDSAETGEEETPQCANGGALLFERGLPACIARWEDDAEVSAYLLLDEHPITDRMNQQIDRGYENCGGSCAIAVRTFTYEPIIGVELSTGPAVRAFIERGMLGIRDDSTDIERDALEELQRELTDRDMEQVFDLTWLLALSDHLLAASILYSERPGPGTLALHHDFLMLFPDTR